MADQPIQPKEDFLAPDENQAEHGNPNSDSEPESDTESLDELSMYVFE
jgi:hypothetical protein